MRIAILTPTLTHFSGIDRVVELQARTLAKNNQVSVFTLLGGITPRGFSVVELGAPKSLFCQRLYRIFLFLDRKKIHSTARMLADFDLVICHFYPMTLIAGYAKKMYGTHWRYHNHGVAPPELFSTFFERLYIRLFRWFSNRSVRSCDEAVSISRYLSGVLKQETGISSTVESNSIDRTRFHKKVSGSPVRQQYHLGKNPVCLYVGRLSPHKGIDFLIQAYRIAKKTIPSLRLLIVGKKTFDSYFDSLKTLADDGVVFVDAVNDVDLPSYYAACDVYTTASLWEGFNLTVVEAQACGKPVVAFRVCAHPEVVKKGILVPVRDVEKFAEGIVKIVRKKSC